MVAVRVLFTLLVCFQVTNCCNDYKLKLHHVKSCEDASIIRIQNVTATMDANCMIMTKGCIVISKPYKTAKAKYQLQKPPMPDLKGNVDVCKELSTKKRKSVQLLSSLGFKCPSEAKSLCASNPQKLDISKYKKQLHMAAGKSNLKIDVQHDNGKSCVDIAFEIYK